MLAEERGGSRAGTMWVVDPLDGTTNFTRGFPVVAVSVGLLHEGVPVAGVVIAPYLALEFAASRGNGATLNGERLPPLRPLDPSRAVVATGFPFRNKARMPRYRPVMEGALLRFEDLRRAGAAALDLAWTAAGSFDGYFELNLNPWDVAAGRSVGRDRRHPGRATGRARGSPRACPGLASPVGRPGPATAGEAPARPECPHARVPPGAASCAAAPRS